MDWKREAADKLRNYEARRGSLINIRDEIARLEADLTRIRSAATDGTPVSGGTNTREDAVINNIALRQELERTLHDVRATVMITEAGLAAVTDEERLIIDRFYIHRHRGAVERLCEDLAIEKATVYRKRDAALRHFTLAIYGLIET